MPFYQRLDAQGRALGVFVDNAWTSTLDATQPEARSLRVAGGELDLYLLTGPSLAGVLDGFTRLTGRPLRPPRWALGYHQSRWGYPDADTVRAIAQGFRERDLPLDAVWLDIQHMDGFRTFTFDPERFADPEGLVRDLWALGVRTVAIADPGLKVDEAWPVFTDARDQGLLLRHPDGALFTCQACTGPAARSAAEARGPVTLELVPGPTATRQVRVLDGGGDAIGHVEYTLAPTATGFRLTATGDAPSAGPLHLRVRPVDAPPTVVTLDGAPVAGVRHDGPDRSLWITVPDAAAFTLDVAVAPPGPEPALVEVPFVVQVPPDTPRDGAVYIASSVDDWQRHAPLTWQPDGTAAGSLAVPRGAWFDYKFTRGDWLTVEKWPGCEEAANRYGLAAAWPVRSEPVFAWRDRCEGP